MGTPLHALTDKAVSISSTSYKDFVKHSDESIQHVVRKLNDAHERMNLPADDADYLSSEAFGELEKSWDGIITQATLSSTEDSI